MSKVKFRRQRDDGVLMFVATPAARNHVKRQNWIAKEPAVVYENARRAMRERTGSMNDRLALHGLFEVQFGIYAGQSFHWTLENDLGYSAAMAHSFGNDVESDAPLSRNKSSFRKFVLSFPEGIEADQADSVIRLWNDIEEYDKRPTQIAKRHQKEPLRGRFKTKSKVAPGAEATQRNNKREKRKEKEVLAQAITVPAPAPTEPHQLPEPKELLPTHPEIPTQHMHLFNLPENTVGMAYLNIRKQKKPATVAQVSIPASTPACTLPCPILIAPRPSTTTQQFPQIVAPQVVIHPVPVHPEIPAPQMPAQQQASASVQAMLPFPAAPWSTSAQELSCSQQYYRKRKGNPTRAYNKKKMHKTCAKCGRQRDATTGHKQYYGQWFCPENSAPTLAEFVAAAKERRVQKK